MNQNLMNKALELRNKGDNQGAIKLFQKHLKQRPNDLIAKHNLAAALGDINEFEAAAATICQAINSGLNKPQSWLVYARALTGLGKLDAAIDAYKKSVALAPLDVEVQKELCQLIWMTSNNYEAALQPLVQVISSYPQAINLKVMKAELAGQMGNHEDQQRWMEACFNESGKDKMLLLYVSKAALANRDYAVALDYAKRSMSYYSQDFQVIVHYVNCLLANGYPQDALPIVEQAVARFPLDQHLLALQATCWRLLQDKRYEKCYDYSQFVKQLPLGVPKGWRDLDAYMDALEKELDEEHQFKAHPFYLSLRHGSQIASITSSKRRAMRAYSEAVKKPVQTYLSQLSDEDSHIQNRNTGDASLFSAWSVKLYGNGFHVNHVHQQGWLSSACHVRLAKMTGNQAESAGWFKLGEPGPVCKPDLQADKFLQPKRGHIVIFPSYMWHGTVPISGETDRLTVAADFLPA